MFMRTILRGAWTRSPRASLNRARTILPCSDISLATNRRGRVARVCCVTRFSPHRPVKFKSGSKHFWPMGTRARGVDVFSVNIYRYAPARETFDHIYLIAQKPIPIGEFHIGAPERGLAQG